MGRAMRWLKKVLTGGKKEGSKDQSTAAPPIERRRWSFAKARSSVADASRRPSVTAVVAGELSQSRPCGCGEAGAAVLIQKAFRGYLARKALRALKSLVKLQALVRGYLVRKQAATTLHRLQALMRLQASSHALKNLSSRRSIEQERKASLPVAHRRRLSEGGAGDAGFDRSPRIVEMDTCQLRCRSSRIAGRYAADPQAPPPSSPLAYLCKPPSRLQLRELEPRQPKTTQNTPRLPAVVPSGSPAKGRPSCGGGGGRESSSPRYMADTASSVARGRCQSAPRQRHGHNGAAAPGLPRAGSRKAALRSAKSSSCSANHTKKKKAKAMATSDWTLPDHPTLPKGKTVAVVVLDGWGEASPDQYNCIHVAQTPVMDSLKNGAPEKWRLVKAHGTAVGLPSDDDMGNSEVGHNALGAGRIFAQGAKLVDAALASGKIWEDEGFNYIKESFDKGTLHLIGLLSDGGVHSRLDQVQLIVKGASERGAKRIRLHILTDGRDVLDGSSVGFVETIEKDLAQLREQGVDARIASGGGRMYVTMDRYENDWSVVKRGWDAQILGEAPYKFQNALEAVKTLRAEPKANDQYLPPFVIVDESGKSVGPIVDGDAVVTFNFRADRMVMLAKALEFPDFDKFDRVRVPKIKYAGMLQYDGELKLPSKYLVSPPLIERTSGEYLVKNGVRTFACSETVKFGHVTFFWNGNRSGYFDETKEEYVEIPSDSGITFNEQPKMKALEIAERTRDAILSGKFDQVRINLPNGDMVGHTGDIEATVVACKAADEAVKMVLDAVEQVGGIYLVTADHGNAEDMVKRNKAGQPMLDKSGSIQILTSHTLQPVPVAIGGPGLHPGVRFRSDIQTPGLANVAATVMNLHGFQAPADYETTLIEVVDK